MRKTALARLILASSLTVLAACSARDAARAAADPACFTRTSDKIGGSISLIANDGARMTEANFKGRKSLVFFGFTHCPDICPATLFKVGSAMTMLPEGVKPPRTLLVSVDPSRDTPEALTQYISSNGFPADIVGLTGTSDELENVARSFVAPFERVDDPDSAAGYFMNHTTILYLMDENWKLATFFMAEDRPEDIAACIAALD